MATVSYLFPRPSVEMILTRPYLLPHNSRGFIPLHSIYLHQPISESSVPCIINSANNLFCKPIASLACTWEKSRDSLISHSQKLPLPIRNFPWNRVLVYFMQIIIVLVYSVSRVLYIPALTLSSLSEISRCIDERRMILIPIPFLAGLAVATVLNKTALDVAPKLKAEEIPWHVIGIAAFFITFKLPGPYYPYWIRMTVPHFANGGLWRTLWYDILWKRSPAVLYESDGPAIGKV